MERATLSCISAEGEVSASPAETMDGKIWIFLEASAHFFSIESD